MFVAFFFGVVYGISSLIYVRHFEEKILLYSNCLFRNCSIHFECLFWKVFADRNILRIISYCCYSYPEQPTLAAIHTKALKISLFLFVNSKMRSIKFLWGNPILMLMYLEEFTPKKSYPSSFSSIAKPRIIEFSSLSACMAAESTTITASQKHHSHFSMIRFSDVTIQFRSKQIVLPFLPWIPIHFIALFILPQLFIQEPRSPDNPGRTVCHVKAFYGPFVRWRHAKKSVKRAKCAERSFEISYYIYTKYILYTRNVTDISRRPLYFHF